MHRVSSIHCILSAILSVRNMSSFAFCYFFRHSEENKHCAQLTINTQSTHAQCTSNMRTMSINMLYTTQSLRFIIVIIIIIILNSSCLCEQREALCATFIERQYSGCEHFRVAKVSTVISRRYGISCCAAASGSHDQRDDVKILHKIGE